MQTYSVEDVVEGDGDVDDYGGIVYDHGPGRPVVVLAGQDDALDLRLVRPTRAVHFP